MCRIVSLFVRLCMLGSVVGIVAGIPATAEAGSPLPATNQITNVKYAEKLSRAVKFEHLGPFLGHHYYFNDKGSVNLSFTVSLEGIDTTKITKDSVFFVSVESTEDVEIAVPKSLSDDPKFETGDTKAKITVIESFGGTDSKTGVIQIAINPALALLQVKIKGKYVANFVDGVFQEEAGPVVLADNYLDAPSGVFFDDAIIQFGLTDGMGEPLVIAEGPMTFAGQTKVTVQTDDEIGSFNATKIGVVGATPPP